MNCQWQELINILPVWLRKPVDEQGKAEMQELRLRLHQPPEIIKKHKSIFLDRIITSEDLNYTLNTATRYSPWTAETVKDGFVTAAGGHRIGLCGEYVNHEQSVRNISHLSSLCIRIAREIPGVSGTIYNNTGSILIIGSPGSGKTTLLRDLICKISDDGKGTVVVVDERRELFPCVAGKFCFKRGRRTDVLSGCKKTKGLDMALRTMGPSVIAVDEITAQEDCEALLHAAWCGVRLIATAHAGSKEELFSRTIYAPILEYKLFDTFVILNSDQTWQEERIVK